MLLRDLFRGWQISVRSTGADWWVQLLDDDDTPVIAQTCPTAAATLRLTTAWIEIMDDDTPVTGDLDAARRQVSSRLNDAVARMDALGGPPAPPPAPDDDGLRAWFTRQMDGP
jgi:hypothetical protein